MAKKTTEFTVDGKVILVDSLPKDIRDSFNFFDRISEDLEDITHKYNILLVAATAMKNKIYEDIKLYTSTKGNENINMDKDTNGDIV